MFKPERHIDELRLAVSWAKLNYEIFWVYKSEETRPKFADTMNRYNLFFRTSIHAHFVALIMALYRIYETRSDTYNVPELLKLLRKHKSLESDVLEELDDLCKDIKPIWIKICILRNEAFAHRSLEFDITGVFKKAKMKPDELRTLIEKTESLINKISKKFNGGFHAFNTGSGDAIIKLLEDLRE